MKTKILLFLMVLTLGLGACKKKKAELQTAATQMMIVNQSDTAVTVWITLGATPGCIQNIGDIPFITDSLAPLVGSFVLQAGDSTIAYAPEAMGYNGNLSFNTQPMNCPTEKLYDGVNIFEFIINNSFQAGNPQETVDISCVAGVNCRLKVFLSKEGTVWNAGPTQPKVDSIYNVGLTGNSGLVGVYPYGCDTCTGRKNPPSCISESGDRQTNSICNVQRDAIGHGGLITVIYLGSK